MEENVSGCFFLNTVYDLHHNLRKRRHDRALPLLNTLLLDYSLVQSNLLKRIVDFHSLFLTRWSGKGRNSLI